MSQILFGFSLLLSLAFQPLYAMDSAPESYEVAHLFIIDFHARKIALADKQDHFDLPSVQVGNWELSDEAILKHVEASAIALPSPPMLVGRIDLVPHKEHVFSFHNILSLFGLNKSRNEEQAHLQKTAHKIRHNFYLVFAASHKCGFTWIALEDIHSSYNKSGTKKIEPAETIDILRLMASAREGKKIDIGTAAPELQRHFKEKDIKADVAIFVPPRLMDMYYANFEEKKSDAAITNNAHNDEAKVMWTLLALPFLATVVLDSRSDHCQLF